MALLGIGIFSGVVITKTVYNKTDNGQSVDVTFKKLGEEGTGDSLDFLNSAEVGDSDAGKENNIRIYGVNLTGYDGQPKTGDVLLNEVLQRKDQLVHILQAYLTQDKIVLDITKGVAAKTKTELVQKITQQATLDKMVENLFTQFVELLKTPIEDAKKKLVVKFLRKSKASNFPRLADRKLDWNPFIADADNKALVGKIKFSDWEKEQGFDSNAQSLEGADGIDAEGLAAQKAATDSVFG